ncbi:MAG: hypothetical protein QNJ68_09395 [Microcoleaceae cyanobacterium MO_207.B10]|nr:hypothetical protein [Microcoleaceae cyanobacterium MO_207.B10]
MSNLFNKNFVLSASKFLIRLGQVLIPLDKMESPVFHIKFDGLLGEGEIVFDGHSITGVGVETVQGSDLPNGYFNQYLSGEDWQDVCHTAEQEPESYPQEVIVSNRFVVHSYSN